MDNSNVPLLMRWVLGAMRLGMFSWLARRCSGPTCLNRAQQSTFSMYQTKKKQEYEARTRCPLYHDRPTAGHVGMNTGNNTVKNMDLSRIHTGQTQTQPKTQTQKHSNTHTHICSHTQTAQEWRRKQAREGNEEGEGKERERKGSGNQRFAFQSSSPQS